MNTPATTENQMSDLQRRSILQAYKALLAVPMLLLGLVWLVLAIVELLEPSNPLFNVFGAVIWFIFIVDFALRLSWAPQKLHYLRANWLVALSLLLPAVRVFQLAHLVHLLQAVRLASSLNLVPAVASLNHSLRELSIVLGKRGFGYAVALSLLITFAGAAGMYVFEHNASGGLGLDSYGSALWFTAMIMTTMGSDYWPSTPEGRILCVLLSLYAITIFGYVTATLASFFVGRDTQSSTAVAGPQDIETLHNQLETLTVEIRALTQRLPEQP